MNRYTQFTPQQYVESFVETPTMDFPFQETMAIKAYNQKREDDFMAKLGEAEGQSTPYGYLTKELATAVDSEMKNELQKLSADFPNISKAEATRRLHSTVSKRANDPRVKLATEDYALKPTVTQQMGQAGYGINSIHAGLIDPETKRKLAAGELTSIDPSVYRFMNDPGKVKTLDPIVTMIDPKISGDYEMIENEDGTKSYKEKSTSKIFDWATVSERIERSVDAFTNEDGSIKMDQLLSNDMQEYVAFRQTLYDREGQGRKYDRNALVSDLRDVAELRFSSVVKKDISGMGNTSTKKKTDKDKVEETFLNSMIGNVALTPLTDQEITDERTAIKSAGIVSDTDGYYIEAPNDKGGVDRLNTNFMTSDNDEVKQQGLSEYKRMLMNSETKKVMDQVKTIDVNGNKVMTLMGEPTTQEDINRTINENYNIRNGQIQKLTKAKFDADLKFKVSGLQFTNKELTPEEKNALERLKTPVKNPDGSYIRKDGKLPYSYADMTMFDWPEDAPWTVVNGKKQRSWEDAVPKRVLNDPAYKKYNEILQKEINEEFQSIHLSTKGIVLEKVNEATGKTEIPESHKKLYQLVDNKVKSKDFGIGRGGVNYEGFFDPENIQEGKNIHKLKSGNDYLDFSNNNNPDFVPMTVYWDPSKTKDGRNGRWVARGNFKASDSNGKPITSDLIELDITDELNANILTSSEKASTYVNDIAIDNVSTLPKGITTIAATGLSMEQEKKYGDLYVTKDVKGNYTINGKMVINGGIVDISSKEARDVLGYSTNIEIPESAAIDMLAKVIFTRHNDAYKVKIDPSDTPKLLQTIGVNENRIPTLTESFSVIEDKESKSFGSYDAMNTGGSKGGLNATGSTTGTEAFGKPLYEHTVGEIIKYQDKDQPGGRKLNAAGKFQVIPSTMLSVKKALGLRDTDPFNEETQTMIATHLFESRVDQAANAAAKNWDDSISKEELKKKLFKEGVKDPDIGDIGYMVSEWRGLINANEEEQNKILNAAIEYLTEKKVKIS